MDRVGLVVAAATVVREGIAAVGAAHEYIVNGAVVVVSVVVAIAHFQE